MMCGTYLAQETKICDPASISINLSHAMVKVRRLVCFFVRLSTSQESIYTFLNQIRYSF